MELSSAADVRQMLIMGLDDASSLLPHHGVELAPLIVPVTSNEVLIKPLEVHIRAAGNEQSGATKKMTHMSSE